VEIGVGGADADARQLVFERKTVGQRVHRLTQIFDVSRIIVYMGIFLGRNDRFGIEVAVLIDKAEGGVDAADIHADREFFHIVFQVKS